MAGFGSLVDQLVWFFEANYDPIWDSIDISIVVVAVYWVCALLRGTRAVQVVGGILALVALRLLAEVLQLTTTLWILDTFLGYGGMGRHGGGAFSGKDCTKVDRSASYAARWVAKHVVAAGFAERCEIQLAYAIGVARPLSINVETFGTGTIEDKLISQLISEVFDLRPGAIIRDLDLRRPIYRQTASYGHFGRDDLDLPWERTARLDALQASADRL